MSFKRRFAFKSSLGEEKVNGCFYDATAFERIKEREKKQDFLFFKKMNSSCGVKSQP